MRDPFYSNHCPFELAVKLIQWTLLKTVFPYQICCYDGQVSIRQVPLSSGPAPEAHDKHRLELDLLGHVFFVSVDKSWDGSGE